MSVASAERLAKDLKALEEELSNKTEALKREYEKKMKERLEVFQKETFSTLTSLNVTSAPKEKEEREEEEDEEEESDESGSFILEDDDEDEIPDDDDEDDLPPPVHYKMKPVTKKRARARPVLYDDDNQKEDDDEEGDDCDEPHSDADDEQDQWNTVKNLTYEDQKANPWFRKRYLDPFEGVRKNMGMEGNNEIPNLVWNNVAESPSWWFFKKVTPFYSKCALCNYKRKCSIQGLVV